MQGTIGQYFGTMHCPICKALTVDTICASCKADPQKVAVSLNTRIQAAEREHSSIVQVHVRHLALCMHMLWLVYFAICLVCVFCYMLSQIEIFHL